MQPSVHRQASLFVLEYFYSNQFTQIRKEKLYGETGSDSTKDGFDGRED